MEVQLSIMKFTFYLLLISFVIFTMSVNTAFSCFASVSGSNSSNFTSNESYSDLSNQTEQVEYKYGNNTTSLGILSGDEDKGLLIVKVTTLNGKMGLNTSSDFIVNIHANNPTPASFKGGLETLVKLSMGMYSVTISSLPNYNSSFSGDCTGGIMKVETKICTIFNTFISDSN